MHASQFARAFAAAVRYSRDHHDVNSLAAGLPFAATRANPQLDGHRAALADALWEAGRDDEAQIAADPHKNLRMLHHPDGYWHFHEAPPRSDDRLYHVHSDARSYLETALWSSTGRYPRDHDAHEAALDAGHADYLNNDRNYEEIPLDERHHPQDFTDEAVEKAQHAIEKFKSRLSPLARDFVEHAPLSVGHALWLTRNGHGSDFGDGEWENEEEQHVRDIDEGRHAPHLQHLVTPSHLQGPRLTEELTAAAHSLGEQDVDVEGDDGNGYQLHLHGGSE